MNRGHATTTKALAVKYECLIGATAYGFRINKTT